jgi:hypothetical protein
LFKVNVRVKVPGSIREVTVVPEGVPLAFRTEGPYVVFEVDRIEGHTMVSLAFSQSLRNPLVGSSIKG